MESITVVPLPPPSHSPPDSSRRDTLFFNTPRRGPAAAPAASSAGSSSESAPPWVSAEQLNHIQGSAQLARLLHFGEMIGEDVFTTIRTLGSFDHREGWHFAQALFRSIRSREQIPDELRPYLEQEHLFMVPVKPRVGPAGPGLGRPGL